MARTGVVHFEHNGAGVILSEALKRQGYRSTVVATAPHPFGFKEDILLPAQPGVSGGLRRLSIWMRLANREVFHNHGCAIPGVARKLWRGRIIQHYHNRVVEEPIQGADLSLVSMPGNLRTVPLAIWVPLPVRTDVFVPPTREDGGPLRIGFCADRSDPDKPALIPFEELHTVEARCRGMAVLAPLRGLEFDYAHIRDYYAGIDIWVDRIGVGFYGLSAIEAASMGIPIVTQIGRFEADLVPGCPFVSVGRDAVQDAVESLVHDRAGRRDLGSACRDYVVALHDADTIASQLMDIYATVR
jgi:hypothetical protein